MVFHNKDSESMAMQIAKKMISKRLKHNFNDRVFDLLSGTIVEHTITVSTKFYKVNSHTFLKLYSMTHTNIWIQSFENASIENPQDNHEVGVSFIFENEYICKNPNVFPGLI